MARQAITMNSDGAGTLTVPFASAIALSSPFIGQSRLRLYEINLLEGTAPRGSWNQIRYRMFSEYGIPEAQIRAASQWITGGALEYEVSLTIEDQIVTYLTKAPHRSLIRETFTTVQYFLEVGTDTFNTQLLPGQYPPSQTNFPLVLDTGVVPAVDVSAEFQAEAGVSMSARPIAGAYVQPTFTALGGVSMDARVTGPPTPRPIFNIPLDVRMDVGINTKDVAASFRADVTARMSVNIQHDKSVAASFNAPIEARMAAVVSHDKTARPGVFSVPIDTRFDVNVEGTKSIRPTFNALDGVSIEAGVRADRHVRAEFVALDGVRIAVRIPRQYVDTPGFYRLDADTGMRFDTHKIYDGDALTQALYDRMAVPLGYRTTRPGYGAGPFEATPHPDDAAISLRAALLSDPQVSAVSHQVFYEPSGARIDFAVTADVGGEPTELALSVNL